MISEIYKNVIMILFISQCCTASEPNPPEGIAIEKIFRYMGWKALTFIPCPSGSIKSIFKRLKDGSAFKLQINVMEPDTIDMQTLDLNGRVVVDICDGQSISTFAKILSLKRPSDSTLALVTNSGIHAELKETFSEFSLSRSFFRTSQSQLYHHVTFRLEKRLLEHKIDCKPLKCTLDLKNFSYQGAILYGKAKTWRPWFLLEKDCQVKNSQLKESGVLNEFMSIVSAHFNFTLIPDPGTQWGSLPVTGSLSDTNATFTGIFGDAVKENTDIVLSFYTIMAERNYWVDSTFSMYQSNNQFFVNSQVQLPDLNMLWKPLTLHSWFSVIASTMLVAGGIFLPKKLIRNWNENWYSYRIAVITGWLLFNLVNAHYNGALTMFLSSSKEIEIPTLEKGLELYPSWKMVIPFKNMLIHLSRQSHKPQVSRYLDLVSGKASYLVPNDYDKAFRLLMKPGYFMFAYDLIELAHEFEKISGELQYMTLESVGTNGFTRMGLVLPKYSPHTRIFNSGHYIHRMV